MSGQKSLKRFIKVSFSNDLYKKRKADIVRFSFVLLFLDFHCPESVRITDRYEIVPRTECGQRYAVVAGPDGRLQYFPAGQIGNGQFHVFPYGITCIYSDL